MLGRRPAGPHLPVAWRPAVMPPALLLQQVWRGAAPAVLGATPVTGAVGQPGRAAVKVRGEGRRSAVVGPARVGVSPGVGVDVLVAALIVRPVDTTGVTVCDCESVTVWAGGSLFEPQKKLQYVGRKEQATGNRHTDGWMDARCMNRDLSTTQLCGNLQESRGEAKRQEPWQLRDLCCCRKQHARTC